MRSRSVFGDAVLLAFLLTQLFDGVFTYLGIATFGPPIEGNPLVGWYVIVFGAGIALVGAKGFAVACGAALHWRAMHRTLGMLTILYLAGAVWPWTQVLWP
jgi:hypothetical protein